MTMQAEIRGGLHSHRWRLEHWINDSITKWTLYVPKNKRLIQQMPLNFVQLCFGVEIWKREVVVLTVALVSTPEFEGLFFHSP